MRKLELLGFTLDEAKKILHQRSIAIKSIFLTKSPKDSSLEHDDHCRIVRYRLIDGGNIEIFVCKPYLQNGK